MSTGNADADSSDGKGNGNGNGNGNNTAGVTVTDAPDSHRYEARAGGELAGIVTYLRTPDMIAFVHTEVEDAYEGRGVGSALARAALDEARTLGLRVVAVCPFIDGWMSRHPEYDAVRYEPASRVSD